MMFQNSGSNILIYDKSEKLIKITKHYNGRNVDVTFCNGENKLSELELKDFDLAYLNINDDDDLSYVFSIILNVKNVYVNTTSKKIKISLQFFDKIVFFDLEKDKFKIMDQIFNTIIGFY